MSNSNDALKKRIQKHLAEGKTKLVWLERKIMDEKSLQKLKDEFEKSKEKLTELKDKFNAYEEKASKYIDENPKKALAMATAAGVLAGSLWGSYKKKKK